MRAPLAFAALAALVTPACAPTLAAPGEDSRFLADFPECPYEWLTMVEGSSRASLYMAAVREGGDAMVNAHENRQGNRTWRSTSEPRWRGSAIKLLDPACQLDASAVTQSPSASEHEILAAAIGYYNGVIIWTTHLGEGVIAIDVRPATVPNRRGPQLDPDRAAHAHPELLRQVAADLGSPVGEREPVECRPVEDPRGAYCTPAVAAAVIGVGRLVHDGDHAQVEVRAWYPWEGPRQLAEMRGGQLSERGDLLTLERVDGEWRVVNLRGLFIS
jgi:hypothetical protein